MKAFRWAAFFVPIAIVAAVALVRTVAADDLPVAPANNFAGFKYQFWNSQLYPYEVINLLAWVDDDTLLVKANSGPKPKTMDEARARREVLYLWKLGEKPKLYGEDPETAAQGFCTGGGIVQYGQKKRDPESGQSTWFLLKGPLGQEKAAPEPVDYTIGSIARREPANKPEYIPRTDCDSLDDPAMKGRIWVTDPNKRYYLDFGDRPFPKIVQPVVFMKADGTNRVELPISNIDVSPACTQFHQFDGAFLVWNCIFGTSPVTGDTFAKWRQTNCHPAWRIKPPDGATEKICLPYGEWAGFSDLVPTKAGSFLLRSVYDRNASARPRRVRLVPAAGRHGETHLRRLYSCPVVSPNGCRVVFRYGPSVTDLIGSPYAPTIMAIDLCHEVAASH